MPHLFISYAKADTRELALSLADKLNTIEGVTAWVDRSLRAGRSWELQIQSEIDRCDAMIVLYSPDINRHKQGKPESYVLTEIAYAKYTAKKLIIPVMAQRTNPPMSLTMEHYIDFTLNGLVLDDLVVAICDELEIAAQQSRTPPSIKPAHRRSQDILPAPFEWIEIPAGKVTLSDNNGPSLLESPHGVDKTFSLNAFSISKYPITNSQYAEFVEAGGYIRREWWTDAGWNERKKSKVVEPWYETWKNAKWNSKEQPIVGITWYEAIAFCAWLSDLTEEKITLPTEQQWQRAAQGDEMYLYPWGNNWEESLCRNSLQSDGNNPDNTSPVTSYDPRGNSPFGVSDLAGNIWEWCLTDYQTGSNEFEKIKRTDDKIALRGGSWKDNHPDCFKCAFRNWTNPLNFSSIIGFRICRH